MPNLTGSGTAGLVVETEEALSWQCEDLARSIPRIVTDFGAFRTFFQACLNAHTDGPDNLLVLSAFASAVCPLIIPSPVAPLAGLIQPVRHPGAALVCGRTLFGLRTGRPRPRRPLGASRTRVPPPASAAPGPSAFRPRASASPSGRRRISRRIPQFAGPATWVASFRRLKGPELPVGKFRISRVSIHQPFHSTATFPTLSASHDPSRNTCGCPASSCGSPTQDQNDCPTFLYTRTLPVASSTKTPRCLT